MDFNRSTAIDSAPPAKKKRKRPYNPNHFVWEMFTLFIYYVPGVMGVLMVILFLIQFPMEPQANPAITPLGIAPEWYFLAMFQVLKMLPLFPAICGIVVYLMLVMFLPFIDFSKIRRGQTTLMKVIGWINIVFIIIMTFWGGHWLELYIYPMIGRGGH